MKKHPKPKSSKCGKSYHPIYMKTTVPFLGFIPAKYNIIINHLLRELTTLSEVKPNLIDAKYMQLETAEYKFIDTLKLLAPDMNLSKLFKLGGCE